MEQNSRYEWQTSKKRLKHNFHQVFLCIWFGAGRTSFSGDAETKGSFSLGCSHSHPLNSWNAKATPHILIIEAWLDVNCSSDLGTRMNSCALPVLEVCVAILSVCGGRILKGFSFTFKGTWPFDSGRKQSALTGGRDGKWEGGPHCGKAAGPASPSSALWFVKPLFHCWQLRF